MIINSLFLALFTATTATNGVFALALPQSEETIYSTRIYTYTVTAPITIIQKRQGSPYPTETVYSLSTYTITECDFGDPSCPHYAYPYYPTSATTPSPITPTPAVSNPNPGSNEGEEGHDYCPVTNPTQVGAVVNAFAADGGDVLDSVLLLRPSKCVRLNEGVGEVEWTWKRDFFKGGEHMSFVLSLFFLPSCYSSVFSDVSRPFRGGFAPFFRF
jgi:hypothetical protein